MHVGTLDDSGLIEPDIHIYTRSKTPWFDLPGDKPAMPANYLESDVMTPESLVRMAALRG